jgi:uncharacterized protein (DUF2252 family)
MATERHDVPRRRAVRGVSWLCVCVALGCSPAAPLGSEAPVPSASAAPVVAARPPNEALTVPFAPADFAGKDELLSGLVGSRFRYFRYVNGPFSRAVCRRFSAEPQGVAGMPTVNLHGDAHLEQYAVALDGRGLADFDAATLGPPVMDWLRFATSLWLAADGDDAAASAAIAAFIRGYRASLADAAVTGPEPQVAVRMRAKWGTPTAWLDGVQRLMVPIPPEHAAHMASARAEYVAQILKQNPDLDAGFFEPKSSGALKMGVGSAHEEKMLMRVEGATAAPDDDVILEIKQLGATTDSECTRGDSNDARRVIVAQSRMGSPQRFLGTCRADDKKYYVHAWRMHYRELDVGDVHGAAELAELAYDVGLQLGKGHPKHLERDGELRKQLGALLDRLEPEIAPISRELAGRVDAGWRRFREDACRAHPIAACASPR